MLKNIWKKAKESENKGFTLVELIVVIVILAILIGVTIGGIYMYVGQSRTATDTNNASAITSTLSTMAADQDIYNLAASADSDTTYKITWSKASTIGEESITTSGSATDSKLSGNTGLPKKICEYMAKVLTNGLPESQTGNGFTLTITLKPDDNGSPNVYVNCVDSITSTSP